MTQGASATGVVTTEGQLVRALGTFGLAAGIVNITIGGGIFRLPADASSRVGAAAPIAYLICAVAMGIIVLCIADAASRVSMTGGPYAYIETAFGPFVGFMSGALLWLLSTFAMSAVSTVFAANIGALFPWFATPIGRTAFLVGLFTFFAAVNVRGVKQGATLNNIVTLAKLAPLLLLAIGGLFFIEPANVAITTIPAAADLARAAIVLVFAFAGIEAALIPSGEVANPARTLPRAIFLAMGGVTLLYMLLQLVARGVLGEGLSTSTAAPLADAARAAMGNWAGTLLLAGASISMFGHAGGMMLAVSRVLFAFARDGFLPKQVAAVHPKFHTPHVAIAIQAAVAIALAASSSFERLAVMANISVLLLYGGCCLASWQLRRRDVRQGGIPFKTPAPGLLPWLGCAVIAWMFTSITAQEWIAIGAALLLTSVVYLVARRRPPAPVVTGT